MPASKHMQQCAAYDYYGSRRGMADSQGGGLAVHAAPQHQQMHAHILYAHGTMALCQGFRPTISTTRTSFQLSAEGCIQANGGACQHHPPLLQPDAKQQPRPTAAACRAHVHLMLQHGMCIF